MSERDREYGDSGKLSSFAFTKTCLEGVCLCK